MGRVTATLAGVLVLALLAGVFTEATLAVGHRGQTTDDSKARPTTAVKAVTSRTPSPTPSAAASATPAATPTPTPALQTATTNAFVHMRADKSTTAAILFNLDGGTVVYLLPDSDAQWQQVQYNGTSGYIFKSYLAY